LTKFGPKSKEPFACNGHSQKMLRLNQFNLDRAVGLGWIDMGAKEWSAVVLEKCNWQYHSQVAFYCSCKWWTNRDPKGINQCSICLFVFHCTT
jgi:hypothetical protein